MEKILPIILYCVLIFSRYRRCPADKLLVIYGRIGNEKNGQQRSFVCIHGGAAFRLSLCMNRSCPNSD